MTTENCTVLDKGFVKLIEYMGSDLLVVNAARVSFDKKHEVFQQGSDDRLIAYLARHNHWTPFAHPQVCLHIKAPIFVRTQLFKHKQGLVENEISRRYVDSEPEFYLPDIWRGRPEGSVKQGSGEIEISKVEYPNTGLPDSWNTCPHSLAQLHYDCLKDLYKSFIDSGVAPEMARIVLPQSTYTEWYWTGSLAAFARVFNQRSHETAQWEVQQYAEAISSILSKLYPVSWAALTAGVD